MRKQAELTAKNGCLSRAADNEMIFVLRGHDIAAPATIRFWVGERVRLGKNLPNDGQLREALACAEIMESERPEE